MSSSTQIGRVFGIPIRVHVTLWIVLAFAAVSVLSEHGGAGLLLMLLTAAGVFASIAFHELAHSVVAMAKGCRVREILLLPIGGVAQLDRMPSQPADELLVALVGPLASFALGGVLGLLSLTLGAVGMTGGLLKVLGTLAGLNVMLGLFNLLPSFPMDGGRIFRAWMTPHVGRLEATRRAAKTGRIMAVLFGIIGVFQGRWLLVVIALFIYFAAGAEYRMVRIQEAAKQTGFGPWPTVEQAWPHEDEVIVSPPPYRRGRASSLFVRPVRMQHDLFDDLFRNWQ